LLTSGRYEPSSEYPGLNQITLGPQMHVRNTNIDIFKEFDYRGLEELMRISTNRYNETYEKYKSGAIDHNIDLFFCDIIINDACLDIGYNLKKPVVGLISSLQSNFK